MSTPSIEISYGRGHLPIRLSADARPTIICKPSLPKIHDQRGAVRHALDHPIRALPFQALAQGRRSG